MKLKTNNSFRVAGRMGALFMAAVLLFTLTATTYAQSPQDKIFEDGSQPSTEEQLKSYAGRTAWYDSTVSGACGVTASTDVGGVSNQNETVIKAIIGIAKTYQMGERGALIGLMAGLAESNLKIYASAVVPESKTSPHWLAVPEAERAIGSDHDSVGSFQQRPSTGWSTYGANYNNEPAETKKQIAWQLMDPVYNAQAFFGTPPSAILPDNLAHPGALRKGVLNKNGWETKDPWLVAQDVQRSAFSDGRNYRAKLEQAQSLLSQYWASSPAVSLPISIEGGAAGGSSTSSLCPSLGGGTVFETIAKYAWPKYCGANASSCPGRSGSAITPKPEYLNAIRAAQEKGGEYTGDTCHNSTGIDCGAFVTRVMRDSGADPEYNKYNGFTGYQLQYLREAAAEGKYTKVPNSEPLQPGDIAIRTGHTYIYVGDAMKAIVPDWEGDTASSSQCERAPMAGPNDNRESYEWYRLNTSSNSQSAFLKPTTTPKNANSFFWLTQASEHLSRKLNTGDIV